MLIEDKDLYDIFKLKVDDKIKITKGKMFNDGDILQVSHGGRLEIEGVWRNFGFSDLIGEEFEKVKEVGTRDIVSDEEIKEIIDALAKYDAYRKLIEESNL